MTPQTLEFLFWLSILTTVGAILGLTLFLDPPQE